MALRHFCGADIPVCREVTEPAGRQECLPHVNQQEWRRTEKISTAVGARIGGPFALSILEDMRRIHQDGRFRAFRRLATPKEDHHDRLASCLADLPT